MSDVLPFIAFQWVAKLRHTTFSEVCDSLSYPSEGSTVRIKLQLCSSPSDSQEDVVPLLPDWGSYPLKYSKAVYKLGN